MAERRRYTKREKVSAVTAAVASSTLAAAEKSGIPRSTLRYWMNDPDLAELRQNAREELATGATMVAHLAFGELIRMLRAHELEPRDVIAAMAIGTDKSQLLNGSATARTETRDLTERLDDHERDALADAIDEWLAGRTDATAGVPAVEAGAEVRE
jgi:transposase-like protein